LPLLDGEQTDLGNELLRLHMQGLVHPDLCPDNLLFLGGGVGCVATKDDDCSLVGCFSSLAWQLPSFPVSPVFIVVCLDPRFTPSVATPDRFAVCFFTFSGNFGGLVVVGVVVVLVGVVDGLVVVSVGVIVGVGGLVVSGCLSEAIFVSLVISLFVKLGDFGAAQFELLVPLFFDPVVDLPAPKPRIPQLHFLVAGGVGRARLLMSDEFDFAVSLDEPPSFPLAVAEIFSSRSLPSL
jgi:hypothetical protein